MLNAWRCVRDISQRQYIGDLVSSNGTNGTNDLLFQVCVAADGHKNDHDNDGVTVMWKTRLRVPALG